jgi:hypothetical protein
MTFKFIVIDFVNFHIMLECVYNFIQGKNVLHCWNECNKLMSYVTCILFVSNLLQCTICDMIINHEMLKGF